jgi:hypothetical protein
MFMRWRVSCGRCEEARGQKMQKPEPMNERAEKMQKPESKRKPEPELKPKLEPEPISVEYQVEEVSGI